MMISTIIITIGTIKIINLRIGIIIYVTILLLLLLLLRSQYMGHA